MPFIDPVKRASKTKSTRFSKYKNVDETRDFLLQQLKPKISNKRKSELPPFRIITRYPYHEVAYGEDLKNLEKEWTYIQQDLPILLGNLNLQGERRHRWILEHFTKLAQTETDGKETPKLIDYGEDEGEAKHDGEDDHMDSGVESDEHIAEPREMRYMRRSQPQLQHSQEFAPQMPMWVQSEPVVEQPRRLEIVFRGQTAFLGLLMVSNILCILVRDSEWLGFCLFLIGMNLTWYAAVLWGKPFTIGISMEADPIATKIVQKQQLQQMPIYLNDQPLVDVSAPPREPKFKKSKVFSAAAAAAASPSSPKAKPRADEQFGNDIRDSVNEGQEKKDDDNESTDDDDDEEAQQPSLTPDRMGYCPADSFKCRIGPNYKKNKLKDSSKPELFEFIGANMFRSERKVDHITSLVPISDVSEALKLKPGFPSGYYPEGPVVMEDKINDVPKYFIVNFQLPDYPPNNPVWGKTKEDGRGMSFVLYFRMRQSAVPIFQDMSLPAAQVYRKFLLNNAEEHNRMKCIPRIVRPDELTMIGSTLKSGIQKYNAKPFLTGPDTHQFYFGPNYLECDVDVHKFCFLARKAQYSFMEHLPQLTVDLAFVIEAYGDEEQPENVLASCQLNGVDLYTAPYLSDYVEDYEDIPITDE
jgi:small-conductance mechanosensitive channel